MVDEGNRLPGVIVAFSVTPIGTASASVADEVAEAVRVVRRSGLPSRTDAMFTTIEGEWDDVMRVVKQAVDVVLQRSERVSLVLKADIRPGASGQLEEKVRKVEERLA
jgi:uncharacterized protein (TIGR00106 family)